MKNFNTGYRYYWNKKEQAYIQHEEHSTLSSREIMTLHPGQVSCLLWSTPPLHLCLSVSLSLRSKQTTLLKLPCQLPGRRMEESKRGETDRLVSGSISGGTGGSNPRIWAPSGSALGDKLPRCRAHAFQQQQPGRLHLLWQMRKWQPDLNQTR